MANRNFIKLVTGTDENGELKYTTYVTPAFVSFRVLYEATDIMSGMDEKSEAEAMDIMLDFVIRIYQSQFSKDDLLDGLESGAAVEEISKQIEFIASGEIAEDRKKGTETNPEINNQQVTSWADHKENLNVLMKNMMEKGEQDINTVLDTPITFMMDELYNDNKKKTKESASLMSAFGVVKNNKK